MLGNRWHSLACGIVVVTYACYSARPLTVTEQPGLCQEFTHQDAFFKVHLLQLMAILKETMRQTLLCGHMKSSPVAHTFHQGLVPIPAAIPNQQFRVAAG